MQYPPEAEAAIRAANATGQRVYVNDIDPVIGGCTNCGGNGFIISFAVNSAGPGISTSFVDGQRVYAQTKFYPCPICSNGDRLAAQEYAWQHSGLDIPEREWRIDYIDGLPGKEDALECARALLAMTPAPTGLTTLFGDYGRGKTGVLKSLTAQFTLAGVSARYCRAVDLLGEIHSTYRKDAEMSEEEVVSLVGGIRFLAVDEVDRISATDWAMSTLMRILDTRYARRVSVATMIATNAQPDSMAAQWGYLQNRLRDGARVRVGGQDLRG